ncbi:MAG TPA: hypothetical protein GXX38_02075 [Clostridia bacterium]|jgi:hypothetical protein|nr:hypothetical protein [Clostridia bacterium]
MENIIRKGKTVQFNSFYFSYSLGYFYSAGYLCCPKIQTPSNEFKRKISIPKILISGIIAS